MEKEELYYQLAHTKLVKQDADNRDLEGKAARSIAFAAAVLGAAAALNILPDELGLPGQWYCHVAVGLSFASPIVISVCSLFTLWPRKWRDDPLLDRVENYITNPKYKGTVLVRWAGKQFTNAVQENGRILKQKAWAVTTAHVALVVLILVLVLLRVLCSTN